MSITLLIIYLIFAWMTSEIIRKSKDVRVFIKAEGIDITNPNMLLLVRTFIGLLWLPLLLWAVISMYKDTFNPEDDDEDDDEDDFHPDMKLA